MVKGALGASFDSKYDEARKRILDMISQHNKQAWRNPWVFGLLAVVLSGVLINAKFFWNVTQHPTRVLDEKYSVREHNQQDAKWAQQQAARSDLGWHASLHAVEQLVNDEQSTPDAARFVVLASPATFKLDVADRDNHPIHAAQVNVDVQWPSDAALDIKAKLFETTPGHYEGAIKFPRAGNWDLLVNVSQNGQEFDMEQRVFVAISKQD